MTEEHKHIRRMFHRWGVKNKDLAEEFGYCKQYINTIVWHGKGERYEDYDCVDRDGIDGIVNTTKGANREL